MYRKTIKELHQLLINKEVSPLELAQMVVADLEKQNPQLNNITNYTPLDGYENIEVSDNLLAGIPYVMKDLVSTKDILTTSAAQILKNYKPVYDATLYNHLQDAQCLMVAKANLDQFGIGGTNENSIYGFSRNPYNTKLTTGGSSGGSAGVVASGSVPFAIGSDTGDSTRKPAVFCGIYGYKPTWSLISRYGLFSYAPSFDQAGIFTRCIDDIAIVLEAINGPDEKDTTTLIHQKEYFYQNLEENNKPLKIGYFKSLIELFDNPVVLQQFNETKEYLQSLGHEIVEVDFSLDLLRCVRGVYQLIVNAESSSNLANLTGVQFGEQILGDDFTSSFVATRNAGLTKYTKARNAVGAFALKEVNKENYFIKAKKVRRVLIEATNKVFNDIDIIMAPVANGPAFDPNVEVSDKHSDLNLVVDNHLTLANIVGACGISIPTHLHDDLPYGISFMAKPFNDQLLLNFSKQFETNLLEKDFLNLRSFYNTYKEVK